MTKPEIRNSGLKCFGWIILPTLFLAVWVLAYFAGGGDVRRPVSREFQAIQRVSMEAGAQNAKRAAIERAAIERDGKISPVAFFARMLSEANGRDLSGCPADF